jgi:hypothetical protein
VASRSGSLLHRILAGGWPDPDEVTAAIGRIREQP